jgi:Sugar kinases, ribokinase family
LNKGVKQVLITLGSRGVVYNNILTLVHKPVPKVRVVDTTAAGDAFTSAIAVALSQGKNIDDAVEFGNAAGMLTVTKKGAQTSLPTLNDISQYFLGQLKTSE